MLWYHVHIIAERRGAVNTKRGSPARNFVDSYKAYWDSSADNLYKANSANMNHSLYTQYMSKPDTVQGGDGSSVAGLVRRRQSEWRLFQTGYYDTLGKWYEKGTTRITQIADEIHKYMEANNYKYCVSFSNKYEEHSNQSQCGWNTTFEASKTGYHTSCCATYVSWVLIDAGYLSPSEFSASASGLRATLAGKGWSIITNVNDLQAGDILYYSGHIEIYAGGGKVYTAGSGEHIRGASPRTKNVSSMVCGLRAPN